MSFWHWSTALEFALRKAHLSGRRHTVRREAPGFWTVAEVGA